MSGAWLPACIAGPASLCKTCPGVHVVPGGEKKHMLRSMQWTCAVRNGSHVYACGPLPKGLRDTTWAIRNFEGVITVFMPTQHSDGVLLLSQTDLCILHDATCTPVCTHTHMQTCLHADMHARACVHTHTAICMQQKPMQTVCFVSLTRNKHARLDSSNLLAEFTRHDQQRKLAAFWPTSMHADLILP